MNFEASRETYNLVTAAQTDYNLQLKYDETEHSWLCLAWWISISSPATEETTTMVIILISLTPHTSPSWAERNTLPYEGTGRNYLNVLIN